MIKRLFLYLVISTSALAAQPVNAQKLVSFIDGDSFYADMGVLRQQFRLIGIECPEATPSAKARRNARKFGTSVARYVAVGRSATAFVRKLVPRGTELRIEYDVEKRDKYGRRLAYVFLPDGRMLNEEVLKAGYATLYPTKENVKYRERLVSALQLAMAKGHGLWALKKNKQRTN